MQTKLTTKFKLVSLINKAESLFRMLKINCYCNQHPENLTVFVCKCKNFICSQCIENHTEKCSAEFKIFSIDFLLDNYGKQISDLKTIVLLMLKKEFFIEEKGIEIRNLIIQVEKSLKIFILISLENLRANSSVENKPNSVAIGILSNFTDESSCEIVENFSVKKAENNLNNEGEVSEAEIKEANKFKKKVNEINELFAKLLKNKTKPIEKLEACMEEIQKLRKSLKDQIESEEDFHNFLLEKINFANAFVALIFKFTTENFTAKLLEEISAYEFAKACEENEQHFFKLKSNFTKNIPQNTEKLNDPKEPEEVNCHIVAQKAFELISCEKTFNEKHANSEPHFHTCEIENNKKNKFKNNEKINKNEFLTKEENQDLSSTTEDKSCQRLSNLEAFAGNIFQEKSTLEKIKEIKKNLFKISQRKDIKFYTASKNSSISNIPSTPLIDNIFATSSKESKEQNNHSSNNLITVKDEIIDKNPKEKLCFENSYKNSFGDSGNCEAELHQKVDNSEEKQSSFNSHDSSDKPDNSPVNVKRGPVLFKCKSSPVKNGEFNSISDSFTSEKDKKTSDNDLDYKIENKQKNSKKEIFETKDHSIKSSQRKADISNFSSEAENLNNQTKEKNASIKDESGDGQSVNNILNNSFSEKFNKFKLENFPQCFDKNLKESYFFMQNHSKNHKNPILSSREKDFYKQILKNKKTPNKNDNSNLSNQNSQYTQKTEKEGIITNDNLEEFMRKNKNEKINIEDISIDLRTLNQNGNNFFKKYKDSFINAYSSSDFRNNDKNFTEKIHVSNKHSKQNPYAQTNQTYKNNSPFDSESLEKKIKEKKNKNKFKEYKDQLIPEKVLINYQENLKKRKDFKISEQVEFRTSKKIDLDSHIVHLAEDSQDLSKSISSSETFNKGANSKRGFAKPIPKKFFNENENKKEVKRDLGKIEASEDVYRKFAKNNTKGSNYNNLSKPADSEKSYQISLKLKSSDHVENKENCDPNYIQNKNAKPNNTKKNYNFEFNSENYANFFTKEEKVSKITSSNHKESSSKSKIQSIDNDSEQLLNLLLTLSNSANFDSSAFNNDINSSVIQKLLTAIPAKNEKENILNSSELLVKIQSILSSNAQNTNDNKPLRKNSNINNNDIDYNSLRINLKTKSTESNTSSLTQENRNTPLISAPKNPKEKAAIKPELPAKISKNLNEEVQIKESLNSKKNEGPENLIKKAIIGSMVNSTVITAKREFCSCVNCGDKFTFNKRNSTKNSRCDNCQRNLN
jgi:hypothetical protein